MAATYEEWIYAIFHHPVSNPEWYWDEAFEALWEKVADADIVKYMTRLFLEPELLRHYSLEQVAQSIWFLIGDASPGSAGFALFEPEVPLAERVACLGSMTEFFRRFVAVAAPGTGGEAFDPMNGADPFHTACYMWWDIFPMRFLMEDDEQVTVEPELHQASLKVMEEVLNLPSELCQISALHGLSHWHAYHEERVDRIVEAFVAHAPDLTPRVREYLLQKLA